MSIGIRSHKTKKINFYLSFHREKLRYSVNLETHANMTPISEASLWKLWTRVGVVQVCKYREMYQIQNTFLARALRCFKSCLKRLESRDILSINIIVHWQHSNYKPASSGLISYDKTRRRFDERPSWQKVQTMFFINPTIALKRACLSPSAGNAKRHRCTCSGASSQRERGGNGYAWS